MAEPAHEVEIQVFAGERVERADRAARAYDSRVF
jgi:hypothetical protein